MIIEQLAYLSIKKAAGNGSLFNNSLDKFTLLKTYLYIRRYKMPLTTAGDPR
jgi:hypothetical protein